MLKKSTTFQAGLSVLLGAGLVACKTTTRSSEALAEARGIEQRADASLADELAPASMREANQLLDKAEAAHEKDAGSIAEIHYSRLAADRFRTAMAEATRREAERREENLDEQFSQLQDQMQQDSQLRLQMMQRQLETTQRQLDEVEQRMAGAPGTEAEMKELQARAEELKTRVDELNQQREELEAAVALTEAELEAERKARKAAEQQAQQALNQLSDVGEVQQREDETVIILTGAVLFRSGESKLTPAARQRLQRVADALKMQNGKTIVIEGHTDAQGPEDFNETLSMQRAQSVKEFFVQQGLSEDQIQTEGRGESEPIATNETSAGRANNRRVEIIVGAG